MNKELILKLIIENLTNQTYSLWPYANTDDPKNAILAGPFNLDKIAEVIMKEFENE